MAERARARSFDAMTPLAELKRTHRATWAAGDYPAVAERIDEVPPRDLLDRIDVRPGRGRAGRGHRNRERRAARRGGGRQRGGARPHPRAVRARALAAQDEWGVAVDWVEGDAEELPFDDESFDAVLSVFGVQFAPRHQIVARELARVTAARAGGSGS